jgi:hypothetical protein
LKRAFFQVPTKKQDLLLNNGITTMKPEAVKRLRELQLSEAPQEPRKRPKTAKKKWVDPEDAYPLYGT